MPDTTKKVSPAAVSRALTAAGFQRSKTSPSRIRGMSERGQGFSVAGRRDGSVLVEYANGSFRRIDAEEQRQHLERMAEVLRGKGYEVALRDETSWLRLSVTRPNPPEEG